jgi:hypothetical protein
LSGGPFGDSEGATPEPHYVGSDRVVVHPDLAYQIRYFGDEAGATVRIDVLDEQKHEIVETLPFPTGEGAMLGGGPPRLKAVDLNFDGYQDLMLQAGAGATGNVWYVVWLFDPEKGKFILAPELTDLEGLEADPAEKVLTTFGKGGAAGQVCSGARYRWEGGRLEMVRSVTQDQNAGGFVRVIREMEDGRLVIVRKEIRRGGQVTIEGFQHGASTGVETREEDWQEGSPCWTHREEPELRTEPGIDGR